MRFRLSPRDVSLGCAMVCLTAGAAWAMPANVTAASAAGPGSSWLAGGTARLDRAIDARSAKQGDAIEAKIVHAVKTPDGVELSSGTELHGTVSAVTTSPNGPSSISLRFDKAELKNGRTIPVKVTVTGAYPNDENQLAMYGQSSMAPAEKHVSYKDRFDQEAGTLRHIAMHSRVSGSNSATFSNQNGDVKLRAGTFLQVGIAQQSRSVSTGM